MAITFGNVGGAEPSTVTFKAASVVLTRGSTAEQQEIMVVGDPQTSNAIARVVAAAPGSTEFGLIVRIASGPVSAADNLCQISGNSTVLQGTSPWVIAGNSTVVIASGNSSVLQGTSPWIIAGNSTVVVASGNSSVIVTSGNSSVIVTSGNSSVIVTSGNSSVIVTSGNITSTCVQGTSPWVTTSIMNSTAAPSSNSSGQIVRQVIDNILTVASTNAFGASTSLVIQTSGAALRSYVTAYSITSTVQTPTLIKFYSSGTMIWPFILGALSSAVTGVNLAVSAPAYLFRSNASEALTLQVGTAVAGFRAAVSYFRAV